MEGIMTKTPMIIGNTYRITSKFYAFDSDVLTDCDGDVTLRIYDTAHTQVGSDVTATRESTGTYHADYTAVATGYTWEISGLMGGKPALGTGILQPVVAKS